MKSLLSLVSQVWGFLSLHAGKDRTRDGKKERRKDKERNTTEKMEGHWKRSSVKLNKIQYLLVVLKYST